MGPCFSLYPGSSNLFLPHGHIEAPAQPLCAPHVSVPCISRHRIPTHVQSPLDIFEQARMRAKEKAAAATATATATAAGPTTSHAPAPAPGGRAEASPSPPGSMSVEHTDGETGRPTFVDSTHSNHHQHVTHELLRQVLSAVTALQHASNEQQRLLAHVGLQQHLQRRRVVANGCGSRGGGGACMGHGDV